MEGLEKQKHDFELSEVGVRVMCESNQEIVPFLRARANEATCVRETMLLQLLVCGNSNNPPPLRVPFPCGRKTTPLFFVRLLIAVSRCFPLLLVPSRCSPWLPVASRCVPVWSAMLIRANQF